MDQSPTWTAQYRLDDNDLKGVNLFLAEKFVEYLSAIICVG